MSERIPALQALRAFEVASRYGSFTRAAEELALTQGAVSHHIKTLEAMFGCDLFERRGPKLRLTEHGRLLAQELKVGFKIIENACALLRQDRYGLRLKAASTLTVRWLLKALDGFKRIDDSCSVQLSSVWMDIDTVDFYSEPYDCAILLGSGNFPADVESLKLFDEWLIPVCHPDYLKEPEPDLSVLRDCEFLHPSSDRRDWRRWLARVDALDISIDQGQVFDTLDQGISAAQQGLGISVVDLVLASADLAAGRLITPFKQAVATGDGYYMTWLKASPKARQMSKLRDYLLGQVPPLALKDINYLYG
ncbi:LysR substrate-binding domain-containing protein [Pseudomonas putida]|uniref:LysR substrate-binding domain-containing protein n=1 Tax=Pseudomonas putida TaxID=303 RepID=UPI000819247B|nr:LysR substrate-binding domain-containing protein [Pseudomonas putida]OCT22143.1 LysR family transcriptional regulator [Pseudomonas putida]OCT25509.1 LysR family transcriptional regulator [Pseudomonas putida]OCT26889.1 LysR family transcriptional regulator [Pseudomonas putida]OCT40449.1 LysR family transcriptional regulator [Pseudomonas putida]